MSTGHLTSVAVSIAITIGVFALLMRNAQAKAFILGTAAA